MTEPIVDVTPATPVTRPSRRRPLVLATTFAILIVLVAAFIFRGKQPSTSLYIGLSMVLFVIGAFGVLIRRNTLVLFMCIELMLNAVNIAFVAFGRMYGTNGGIDAHVIVLFVMIVAAAEVAIGLAIIVSIFRRRQSANVDDLSLLKW